MKLLIPLALSLAVSSCPNPSNDELPRNTLNLAGIARADTPDLDRTLARELHFSADTVALAESEKNGLDDFIANTDKRIRELKVILWLPLNADAAVSGLVKERMGYLNDFLTAHKIPYEIVALESPFYADSQGSILAVLE